MIVFLNGRFVPEEQAVVSVFDRSFLFGDGLFETIRCYGGKPFRWKQHLERLVEGAAYLKIRVPFTNEELGEAFANLLRENSMTDGLIRLTLTRGVGLRGYSTKGADIPFLTITCHPSPPLDRRQMVQWKVFTTSVRVPASDPLALYKTCNKLPQIMARAEAEAHGAEEGLLLNTNGEVSEAASSNLFWIAGNTVYTTPLASGILAGVTRGLVMELCREIGGQCIEQKITPEQLKTKDAVFLTMSSFEIVPVISLDGSALGSSPLVEQLRVAYAKTVLHETGQ